MEASSAVRTNRIRGNGLHDGGRRPISRNKQWVAGDNRSRSTTPHHGHSEEGRWERGGHRGGRGGRGGRGSGPGYSSPRKRSPFSSTNGHTEEHTIPKEDPYLETQEERENFYQELVKAREAERKRAIAEGKMDDPLVPKRLEDAITMVGTCMDMCPRFERYRRERENNLFEWETISGTKRVDHSKAVKMYERAAGDKTLPSDLRPPHVLKRTLDYLFHDLLPREGFAPTYNFIRDRSRAVRNDFTMQHETGETAIECHDRCARFHILALHLGREVKDFSMNMEEQQLMNTLQSLKEFYEDQRGRYESPTELEMRVYHRLIHIRDQRERHDDISSHILSNRVFQLTTQFRQHVQEKSSPITKTSALVVDAQAMEIFGQLANVLTEQGNMVMIYLIACILERLFGKDAIDDIESLRGDLTWPHIIDGISTSAIETSHDDVNEYDEAVEEDTQDEIHEEDYEEEENEIIASESHFPANSQPSVFGGTPVFGANNTSIATPAPTVSAFANLKATPSNVFGSGSVFGQPVSSQPAFPSVFGASTSSGLSPFAQAAQATSAALGGGSSITTPAQSQPINVFGIASSSGPGTTPTPTVEAPKPSNSPFNAPAAPPAASATSMLPTPPSPFTPPSQGFLFPSPQSMAVPPAAPIAPKKPDPAPSLLTSSLNPQASPFTPFGKVTPPSSSQGTSSTPPVANPFSTTSSPSQSLPFSPSSTSASTNPIVPTSTSNNEVRLSSLPKLDTTPSISQPKPSETIFGDVPSQPKSPRTPTEPPRLPRQQPISLPSTPTLAPVASNPRLNMLKGSLQTSSLPKSNSSSEILSPIQIQSPTVSRHSSIQNFAGLSTPTVTPSTSRVFSFENVPSPLGGKDKGKGKAPDLPSPLPFTTSKFKSQGVVEPSEAEIDTALSFERKSLVVKETFSRWHKETKDRLAYQEAVRHSENYQDKIRRQRKEKEKEQQQRGQQLNGRASTSLPASEMKKRRISTSTLGSSLAEESSSPSKKRARKRLSERSEPPRLRTDEELAARLKENQEEHQRRWAPGSFLRVLRQHVKSHAATKGARATGLMKEWRTWLSLNSESDATAIWLEKKFDVPESGSWVSESVFSIPILPESGAGTGYPGVLVFECSPLDGLEDELERKYRILDDCSRFRDIVKSFPARRHFAPSVLVIWWSERETEVPDSDLSDMLKKLVRDSVLTAFHIFIISASTKDLDSKLNEALLSLPLDLEGRLVQPLTLSGAFRLFDDKLRAFVVEWIENCAANGEFNWVLYGRLVQAMVELLNGVTDLVSLLLNRPTTGTPHLPSFKGSEVDDSEVAYEIVFQWLSEANARDGVVLDLEGHQSTGKIFPARIFLDHMRELVEYQYQTAHQLSPDPVFYVLTAEIITSLQSLDRAIRPQQAALSHTFNFTFRRSPKRRSLGSNADTDVDSGSKRRRLSLSISAVSESPSFLSQSRSPTPSPRINGRSSPSPSESAVSVSSTAQPTVTTAMLRALTRSLKEKYGSGSGSAAS
ncbi:nuclear export factor [Moniliophthora roreri MCA 2997]|uniref:Nuclear export factor n=1 Tax=Moniliophthora roreri (strain MCA 2997) TaxID=1381753 RepID=V2XDL0_MONRO|nr:nuclear export factor [Moniliophthora roreri MCA 2997]